jgi:hypothetical protein
MEPELVAPVVGYLAHGELCITGEMLISAAAASRGPLSLNHAVCTGRNGRLKDVADNLETIRSTDIACRLSVVSLPAISIHLRGTALK